MQACENTNHIKDGIVELYFIVYELFWNSINTLLGVAVDEYFNQPF